MLFKDYMGGGMSGGQAKALGGSIATAVSSAGSSRATGTALTCSKNIVTTVTLGQGVTLAAMNTGESQIVYNATTTALIVYPGQATVGINQFAVGVGVTVGQYTTIEFHQVSATQILANMSA